MNPNIRLVHKIYSIGPDILLATGFQFDFVLLRRQIKVWKYDKLKIHNSSFYFSLSKIAQVIHDYYRKIRKCIIVLFESYIIPPPQTDHF